MRDQLRHLLAILILPFTVVVLIPIWIAQRYAMAPELGPSASGVTLQLVGVALGAIGLALFVSSLRRFATEGHGRSRPGTRHAHWSCADPTGSFAIR